MFGPNVQSKVMDGKMPVQGGKVCCTHGSRNKHLAVRLGDNGGGVAKACGRVNGERHEVYFFPLWSCFYTTEMTMVIAIKF